MVEGKYSGCSICCAIPSVFIAGDYVVCCVVVLTDVEVESICTGAAIDVSIVVGVGAALVVVDIMPSVLLTGIMVIGVVCAVIDCEVECVDICAGGALLTMVKCICSGCSIGCAVPCVLVTSCHIVSSVVMLIDVEEESICTGAAIDVSIVVSVGAALIVYDIMPSVLLTGILVIGVVRTVVNCQVEGIGIGAR